MPDCHSELFSIHVRRIASCRSCESCFGPSRNFLEAFQFQFSRRMLTTFSMRHSCVETVWAALPEERWESIEALAVTSGVRGAALKRIVGFLMRWNFVETGIFPEFRIRRKIGALSPIKVVSLLRTLPVPELTYGYRKIVRPQLGIYTKNFLGQQPFT